MINQARDYKKEYRDYHGTDKQKKRRASRNKARRKLKKEGRVKDGDGKDVDHKDGNPLNNSPSNLRVTSRKRNRSRKAALRLLSIARQRRAQTDAPSYQAFTDPQANCGLCAHFVRSTECELYSFAADPDYVCNSFEERQPDVGQLKAMIEKLGARNSHRDMADIQSAHDLTCRLGARCNCE